MPLAPRHAAALLAGTLALAACADQPLAPAALPATGPALLAVGGQGNGNGRSSLDLIEDDYAAGLLDKENTNRYREYAVSAPAKLPAKYRSAAPAKDATYSMVQIAREWSSLSAATRKEIRDLRGNGFGNLKGRVETAHFVLHYTTQGDWAVPAQDADRDGTPDFIQASAKSWEEVYAREVGTLGYAPPKLTVDAAGAVSNKFHVYFKDMPAYGYTVPENVEVLGVTDGVTLGTASAWIVVENDFVGFPPNDVDRTGLEPVRTGALEVTQAHEFMHALQFNINVYQAGWLMESHATWAEDAVYDGVNDWHWYINSFFATPELPVFNRYVYGSAFFQNWLSETYGRDVTRQIWLAARTKTAPEAVKAVAFGGTWEPFKQFAQDQIRLRISDFTTDPTSSLQPDPARLLRATHATYPVSETVEPTSKKQSNDAPWGLGANYVEFTPGNTAGTLTLSFAGTPGYAWRVYALVTAGSVTTSQPVPLANAAGTLPIAGFGAAVSRVVLVAAIADRDGVSVPYRYGAAVAAPVVAVR